MAVVERQRRTREYEQEQPDSPGKWWFVGSVVFKGAHGNNDTVVEIEDPQAYDVIAEEGKLIIADVGSVYHGNVEWIGWWMKQSEGL